MNAKYGTAKEDHTLCAEDYDKKPTLCAEENDQYVLIYPAARQSINGTYFAPAHHRGGGEGGRGVGVTQKHLVAFEAGKAMRTTGDAVKAAGAGA